MKGTMLVINTEGHIARIEVDDDEGAAIMVAAQKAVGGWLEKVPHFHSIEIDGAWRRCVALCNEDGKLDRPQPLPRNHYADRHWAKALKRDFNIESPAPDYLVGNIVVLFGDAEFMESL